MDYEAADRVETQSRHVLIPAVVAVASLAVIFMALVRGGGYYVVVPRLAFVVPLAVVAGVTVLASLDAGRRRVGPVAWLALIVAAAAAWNVLVYWVKFGGELWQLLLPLAHPTGIDFRDGLYNPAAAFSARLSGWPPLTLLVGRPFTLFSFSTAYLIQVAVLVALAVVAAGLSAKLAVKAAFAPASMEGRGLDARLLAVVMGLWLLTSYGFMYEVERGNIDLYALVFSLLAVWLMTRSRSAWPPALALALAVGLKLYPAALLVLLFWRYRLKALLPTAVGLAAVFLVAGPANLMGSFSTLDTVQSSHAALGWSNHSAAALAHILHVHAGWPSWLVWPFLIVPLLIWGFTMWTLVRSGWSDRRAVVGAAASMPLMGILPSISHDYRLVLCVFPLAVLAATLGTMRRGNGPSWTLLFGLFALVVMWLARSSLVVHPSLQGSKYGMLVAVQVLLLAVSLKARTEPEQPAPV